MSSLEIILWPLVSVFVALVAIVTIDSNLERRRDRDTAADVLTREGRAAQRYEDLRVKCAATDDTLRHVRHLYDRAAVGIQWLVLDNQSMLRELGREPDHRYTVLTEQDGQNSSVLLWDYINDLQRELDLDSQLLKRPRGDDNASV